MSRLTGATTRVVVVLLLLATVVVPNALAIAAAADTCPTRSGYWFTYDVPDFPSRGPITAFAIDAFRPNKMYATDGTDVVRTTNGGCNWETVYSVAGKTPLDHGFRGEAATIRSIEVPRNPAAGDTVLLLIAEQAGATTRPHVVRSIDTGKTWTAAVGLPPAGDPESIAISPAAPAIGYLGIDVGGGGLDLLFATEDGGARWLPRSDLT
ncbi:MAG TPA: hypothetical protein VHN37_07155, partial [Actinomycetota bacterium]|nr:hypothetical protein [Actinomycetota bacterium]